MSQIVKGSVKDVPMKDRKVMKIRAARQKRQQTKLDLIGWRRFKGD